MKILLSAFSLGPGLGSEPGRAWEVATRLAERHDVWVLSQPEYQGLIEAALQHCPMPRLHILYHDPYHLSALFRRVRPSSLLFGVYVNLYNHLWQLTVYPFMARLHRQVGFDLCHHISFVRYWSPSLQGLLPIPFVWGPLGGGDLTPVRLLPVLTWRGRLFELLRGLVIRLAELDLFVRLTARRSRVALAATPATAQRLQALGAPDVRLLPDAALDAEQFTITAREVEQPNLVVLSVGRLVDWKGHALGLRAFARLQDSRAEYWLAGDGPQRKALQRLAMSLGIQARVKFLGALPRQQLVGLYARAGIFLHPSLHDSGGTVVLEAMAAGLPVVALQAGGPAVTVAPDSGILIPVETPGQVIDGLAAALNRLAGDAALRKSLGHGGCKLVHERYTSEHTVRQFEAIYAGILGQSP